MKKIPCLRQAGLATLHYTQNDNESEFYGKLWGYFGGFAAKISPQLRADLNPCHSEASPNFIGNNEIMTGSGVGLSKVQHNIFDFGKSKSLKKMLSLAMQ